MTTTVDPLQGWTMADMGCHWSRQLPDGRIVYLSTWQNGYDRWDARFQSAYTLTVDFERTDYRSLDEVAAAFEKLAAEDS